MEITDETIFMRQLIDLMNGFLRKNIRPQKRLLEFDFVRAHPNEKFTSVFLVNSSTVIKKIILKHRMISLRVANYPNALFRLSYNYARNNNCIRNIVFSNNMAIHKDIVAICYFYYLEQEYNLSVSSNARTIQALKQLFFDKYCNDPLKLFNEDLTFQKIAKCFPSIMLWMLKFNIPGISHMPFDLFPNLPRMLFSPIFLLILPDEYVQQSLPLLVAIRLASNLKKQDLEASRYLYDCHANLLVIPESLKYAICKQLCIIVENDGITQLVYSPTRYKHIVQHILQFHKQHDEYLQDIKCEM
ncbi:uncharacterized protein LOC109852234 [Pseudomyrmex gracilis]|uniref:uncharacterized protein LOC109852234 n=1 Tax=Pseudomyrmex gracilis TaxID=219809 RepID=UPI000994ADB0|nr:uncharacterized protein LOC109852234 [Pseudomyrmex gracilis]XP_020278793.1 uncharacterized protein LOC109852234 [Pseudomyrmex gracilis]